MTARFDPARITALEHRLRDQFGNPEDFGLTVPPREGVMAEAGKLLLALVGADGGVSAVERQAFGDLFRSYGVPLREVTEAERFDPRTVKLETLVTDTTRRIARPLLYDAIRVARQDGFQAKERAATMRAATALGVDPQLVPALEAQITLDEAVLEARTLLLQVPPEHLGAARGAPVAEGSAPAAASTGRPRRRHATSSCASARPSWWLPPRTAR